MNIIRRNGIGLPTVPSLFDDFFSRELFNWGNNNFSANRTTVPAVNIHETDSQYEVEVAAPGMDKKDFQVSLEGNLLTISSTKTAESEKTEKGYTRREFSYQSFQRAFELPKDVVDGDKITARYENGLLHLAIPKKEALKQQSPRLIEVA